MDVPLYSENGNSVSTSFQVRRRSLHWNNAATQEWPVSSKDLISPSFSQTTSPNHYQFTGSGTTPCFVLRATKANYEHIPISRLSVSLRHMCCRRIQRTTVLSAKEVELNFKHLRAVVMATYTTPRFVSWWRDAEIYPQKRVEECGPQISSAVQYTATNRFVSPLDNNNVVRWQ